MRGKSADLVDKPIRKQNINDSANPSFEVNNGSVYEVNVGSVLL